MSLLACEKSIQNPGKRRSQSCSLQLNSQPPQRVSSYRILRVPIDYLVVSLLRPYRDRRFNP